MMIPFVGYSAVVWLVLSKNMPTASLSQARPAATDLGSIIHTQIGHQRIDAVE